MKKFKQFINEAASWKSEGHYTVDGKEWMGDQHSYEGKVMSGKVHDKDSVALYHYKELSPEVRKKVAAKLKNESLNSTQQIGVDIITEKEKDSRLSNAGVEGFNKAKRTPSHPKKSHIVVAKEGDKIKTIRFGEQGASTAGEPKKGESDKMKAKRKSFKARHGKNIAKGKMSAAYWADKVKW